MGSFGLWFRWILRDAMSRWIQVITIALVIALGTGTYSGLSSTTSWRLKSNDASFAATKMHDLKVTLNTGSFVSEGTFIESLGHLVDTGLILDLEERLSIPTQIRTQGEDGPVMATGRLVGVDFSKGGPHIDSLYFTKGGWKETSLGTDDIAAIDHSFASFNELPDYPVLELPGGRKLHVIGRVLAPEYFVPMDESGFGGMNQGAYAVVFVPVQTVQNHADLGEVVNDVVILSGNQDGIESLRQTVTAALEKALTGYEFSVSIRNEDPVHRILYESAGADQQFYHVIGLAILAGAIFAAFNLTSRIVQAQRREIGLGMAMGSPVMFLALRPLLVGAQIALLGVLLGVFIGILVNNAMRSVLETTLPLPIWLTPFEPEYFLWVGLTGFTLPLLATLMPIILGLRVTPIDAIRAGHLAPVRKGLAPLMSKIPLPGNTFLQIPFRNLLRAPKRSALTLFAVSAVIAVMISVLGMVDSFITTLDTATKESLGDGRPRVEVSLDKFTSTTSSVITSIETEKLVKSTQMVVQFKGTIIGQSDPLDIFVSAIDFNNSLWLPTTIKGVFPSSAGQIMLSTTVARNIGVTVGDTVTIRHPIVTGSNSVKLADNKFKVTGLHPHPVRAYAYVDISQSAIMGMGGIAKSVWVEPLNRDNISEVKDSLFSIPGVAAVYESSARDRATSEALEDQLGVLKIVQVIVLGLALLIAFNTASINMDDRAREHATMMAFGLSVGKIMRMAVLESAAMGVVASIMGIGLGKLLLNYFVYVVFPTVMPEIGITIDISINTYLVTVVMGVVAVGVAPLLTIRKLLKTNIPSTLRVLE